MSGKHREQILELYVFRVHNRICLVTLCETDRPKLVLYTKFQNRIFNIVILLFREESLYNLLQKICFREF